MRLSGSRAAASCEQVTEWPPRDHDGAQTLHLLGMPVTCTQWVFGPNRL